MKIISALEDGHHPPFVLSAAEGQSLSESVAAGDVVVADRVVAATGESLRLDASKPELSHVHLGGVACKSAEQETQWRDAAQTPLAADDWSWFAAQACREVGLPLLAVSVVLEPIPSQKSKDIAALEKQSSLAGQAGALAGMAWKSRQGFRDLWRRQESRWEAGDRLVELAKRLLAETST